MAFKIYTKTGDKGETGLFGGKRLPKNHCRIEAYGTVDELNSFVGLVRDCVSEKVVRASLREIQDRLFTIGANLARDPSQLTTTLDIGEKDVQLLENEIDEMNEFLSPLKNFVLPGGNSTVSFCHLARCVCRRAERMVVALSVKETVEPILIVYLNRLSDYLFVLSRKLGKDLGAEEIVWRPRT